MNRKELARNVYETASLTGEFKLRSGQISKVYFDKYRFESNPQLLKAIAKEMVSLIPPETEILAGLEMGGIPIVTALSFETGLPAAFIRKEAKSYGTCQFAEGCSVSNKTLCLVEDVITTGGAVLDATHALRKEGAQVKDVISVIYRGEGEPQKLIDIGLQVKSLFTMADLIQSKDS